MNILLIEDNPGDIFLIREQFREINPEYTLKVISNGNDVLNYINAVGDNPDSDKPDLIIVDSMLPKINGLEIVAKIRSIKSLNDSCVIMMAGSPDPVIREKALEIGAQEYFPKPEDLTGYEDIISRMLEMAKKKK